MMGCDIHSFVERRVGDHWEKVGDVFPLDEFGREWQGKTHGDNPFDYRGYGLFGFLANVRNYSHSPVIAEPRGLPSDVSLDVRREADDWDGDGHSFSFLTLRELQEYDYDQVFWDRRVTRQEAPNLFNGAALANEGEGRHLSVREFLGDEFFDVLEVLKTLGGPDEVRVVFWFDN